MIYLNKKYIKAFYFPYELSNKIISSVYVCKLLLVNLYFLFVVLTFYFLITNKDPSLGIGVYRHHPFYTTSLYLFMYGYCKYEYDIPIPTRICDHHRKLSFAQLE